MDKVWKISRFQFFCLLTVSLLANDKITGAIGGEFKHDKIISLSIGTIGSIILYTLIWWFYKNMKFSPITKSIPYLLGKPLAKLLLLAYAFYFTFIAMLDTRDISDIVYRYLLDSTPSIFLSISFIAVVFYCLSLREEVLARLGEIIFFTTFLIFILFSTLVLIFNEIHLDNFIPFMTDHSFTGIVLLGFQMSYAIPFGEYFVVLIFLHHLNTKDKSLLTGIGAISLAGFIIISVFVLNIFILSPSTIDYGLSPALRISGLIDIANLIQRFDLITAMILTTLSFVKTCILIYGAKVCISYVFSVHRDLMIFLLLCIGILIGILFYFPNYILLIYFSKEVNIPYVVLLFELIIPISLLLISFFKKPKEIL